MLCYSSFELSWVELFEEKIFVWRKVIVYLNSILVVQTKKFVIVKMIKVSKLSENSKMLVIFNKWIISNKLLWRAFQHFNDKAYCFKILWLFFKCKCIFYTILKNLIVKVFFCRASCQSLWILGAVIDFSRLLFSDDVKS